MKKKVTTTGNAIDDLLSKITPEYQEEVDYRMNLAAKIYRAMKAKGWSQTNFAEEMGKKNSVITRWLSGTHNFETDTLFQIQKKLGINLIDLRENASKAKLPVKQKLNGNHSKERGRKTSRPNRA